MMQVRDDTGMNPTGSSGAGGKYRELGDMWKVYGNWPWE